MLALGVRPVDAPISKMLQIPGGSAQRVLLRILVCGEVEGTTFGLKVEWMNLSIYLKNHSVGYFNNLTVLKCFLARRSPADPVETVISKDRVQGSGVLRLRI